MQPGVYLLLIRQIQRLQLGALVSSKDLQQVVKVGGEHQRAALHQLQHRAQQVLPSMLHLALEVVKHLVEAVLKERGAHVACALKGRQMAAKNTYTEISQKNFSLGIVLQKKSLFFCFFLFGFCKNLSAFSELTIIN